MEISLAFLGVSWASLLLLVSSASLFLLCDPGLFFLLLLWVLTDIMSLCTEAVVLIFFDLIYGDEVGVGISILGVCKVCDGVSPLSVWHSISAFSTGVVKLIYKVGAKFVYFCSCCSCYFGMARL